MLNVYTNATVKADCKKKQKELFQKLNIAEIPLSQYEIMAATELVVPAEIDVSFEDVIGYEALVQEIKNFVIAPLQDCSKAVEASGGCRPQSWSAVSEAPSGVLLFGPPGCGKTMVAKCVAKSANCRFINLQLSSLMDKYFGESEKILKAFFGLAEKVQPCIIFLDEIDCLLGERRADSPESYATLKSFLLATWDGFSRRSAAPKVVVMGATNRPSAIDKAFLRRFDLKIAVPLPDEAQRRAILDFYLQASTNSSVCVAQKERLLDVIADVTEGYSGCALKNLVKFTVQKKLVDASADKSTHVLLTLEDFWAQIERYSMWNV